MHKGEQTSRILSSIGAHDAHARARHFADVETQSREREWLVGARPHSQPATTTAAATTSGPFRLYVMLSLANVGGDDGGGREEKDFIAQQKGVEGGERGGGELAIHKFAFACIDLIKARRLTFKKRGWL